MDHPGVSGVFPEVVGVVTIKLDRRGLTLIELMAAMLILLILMGVLASFMLGAAKSATTARRSAWNGQAVERALTMLRQELAGAIDIERVETNELRYRRVRDGTCWTITSVDGNLIRRSVTDPSETIIMAKDIDSFEFTLPVENLDAYGYLVDPKILWVTVGAGNFKLDDAIYLRNYTH